jgi:TonB family protein
MNRVLSFYISFVAHIAGVGLLLLTPARRGKERPVIVEACRVTLFSPRVSTPSSPRGSSDAKATPRRTAMKKAQPKPDPKPVIVTRRRKVRQRESLPPSEPSSNVPEIGKLEKETLRSPSTPRFHEPAGVGKLSVPPVGTSSFDAYIAGVIKSNWVRPSRAVVGESARSTSVAIRIATDGKITRKRITRSSGSGVLDASAMRAVEMSNPLPIGLPRDMGRPYYDVTIVFRLTDEA